jgi:general secretion pathway protein E
MGVENYLLTSSIVAVLAQRLVRRICQHCKQPAGATVTPDGETITYYKGAGCEHCFHTGYHGRIAIFELMQLNEELRRLIMRNEDASVLTDAARRNGMRNLREDGWQKVARGLTTPDEVIRVTQEF